MSERAARMEDISQGKVWRRRNDRYIAGSKLARRVLFTLGPVLAPSTSSSSAPLISGAESEWNGGRRGGWLVWLFARRPLPDRDAPAPKDATPTYYAPPVTSAPPPLPSALLVRLGCRRFGSRLRGAGNMFWSGGAG